MSVSEMIGPSDGVGDTVTWEDGIGPASTFDVYAPGWQALGPMVVFLSRSNLTPPGLYALSEVASLVLPLDDDRLTFPVLLGSGDPAAPPEWFGGIKTLDDLRAAVQEGPRTIDVGPSPALRALAAETPQAPRHAAKTAEFVASRRGGPERTRVFAVTGDADPNSRTRADLLTPSLIATSRSSRVLDRRLDLRSGGLDLDICDIGDVVAYQCPRQQER